MRGDDGTYLPPPGVLCIRGEAGKGWQKLSSSKKKEQFAGMFLLCCRTTCRVWEPKGVAEEHHLLIPLLLEAWSVLGM